MPRNLTALRFLYAVFLSAVVLAFALFVQQGNRLQTDLVALLPQERQWNEIQVAADKIQEKRLNQQIIALVGHSQAERAFAVAAQISGQWRASGLFREISDKTQPNLTALQHEIKGLRLAVMPQKVQNQLITEPALYFEQYAQQIVNPFAQTSLLPLEQDWLGLGRFVLTQSQQLSAVQWNPNNGMLYIRQQDKTWVLVRAELQRAELINGQQALLDLMEQSRQTVSQQGGELLTAGSALFAAAAKQQAEKESTLMSIIGVSLTLLLLLVVFRTVRVLWLFLPIMIGMLCGIVATVACFGQIHILTLVIGTSLIGVLIDFPLHWLASALFAQQWHPERTMRKLRLTFLVTLLITLLGYGLLWFTVLPVLKQTALFSAVALISAILCTLLYLPFCFQGYQPKFKPRPPRFDLTFAAKYQYAVLVVIAVFVAIGLYKSKWRDDIRQWVAMPPQMLEQAKRIGELTGIDLGSQYFLIAADNDEELLEKDKQLSQRLTELNQPHQSLSQWIQPQARQRQLTQQIAQHIEPADYAVLEQLGLPTESVQRDINALMEQSPVSLQTALNGSLGQGWKTFYLGEIGAGKVGGIIKVSRIQDSDALRNLANQQDIYWQDKPSHLNLAFQQARDQAAWLKVLSFLFAGLLLWRLFGIKSAVKILLIPLTAIVITIACFGWLNMPISLFAMFGLLLVSAIGIDYTAYMHTAQEPLHNKRGAVLLAATTTVISFALLGLSATPAVVAFGLSVSIGVTVSVLITFRFLR